MIVSYCILGEKSFLGIERIFQNLRRGFWHYFKENTFGIEGRGTYQNFLEGECH